MAFTEENRRLTGVTSTSNISTPTIISASPQIPAKNEINSEAAFVMSRSLAINDVAEDTDTARARSIRTQPESSNNPHYARLVAAHSSAPTSSNNSAGNMQPVSENYYCRNSCSNNNQQQSQQLQQVALERSHRSRECISNNGVGVGGGEENVLVGSSSSSSAQTPQSQSEPSAERNSVGALAADLVCDENRTTASKNKPKNSSSSAERCSWKVSELVTAADRTQIGGDRKSHGKHRESLRSLLEDVPKEDTYEELSPFFGAPSNSRDQFRDHIYANLTYIENCYHRQLPIPPARNTPPSATCPAVKGKELEDDNIYENICDKCDQIFSGQLCKNCVKHKQNSGERKKRSFSDFFNSLKRRQKAEKKGGNSHTTPRRLEIVHNVDGFAGTPFKTNQTFDLQEICALKIKYHEEQLRLEGERNLKSANEKKGTEQLLDRQRQVDNEGITCCFDFDEGEVVLRRKRRPKRKKRSGETEVVSKREFPDGDEDEDEFIATDLNLNSVTKHLVAALQAERDKQDLEKEQRRNNVHAEELTNDQVIVDLEYSVAVAPGNIPRIQSKPAIAVTGDETAIITPPEGGVAVVVVVSETPAIVEEGETTEGNCCSSETELQADPVPVLLSPPLENNVCLSVRQWMTSLQFETNDDDDPVADQHLTTTTHSSARVGGENYTATRDSFFVKPIPSRTFEEYFNYPPTTPWPRGSSCRKLIPSSRRSSCDSSSSASSGDNLSAQIDCFKSEVKKNLEQQKRDANHDEREQKWGRRCSASIIITVKDEIYYQENEEVELQQQPQPQSSDEEPRNRRNNYCGKIDEEESICAVGSNNNRVTHENCISNHNVNNHAKHFNCDDNHEIAVKSLSYSLGDWKVAFGAKKCNSYAVLKYDQNWESLESTEGGKYTTNNINKHVGDLLSEVISGKSASGRSSGWWHQHHTRNSNYVRRRRNAITEQHRNSLKFQLITRQLITNSVHRIVFCVAGNRPDQLLLLLKGVLSVNKKVLRKHRKELKAVTATVKAKHCGSAVEIIMGVLSVADSYKEDVQIRSPSAAIVDRPKGQNDLDVVRKETDTSGDRFNIHQKSMLLTMGGELKKISEEVETEMEVADSSVVDNEEEEEGIYQPIWKFHTVGIGRESTSSDTFDGSYNTNDFAEIGDTVEWEIAEEFEFGSSRETLLESSSSGSSTGDSMSINTGSTLTIVTTAAADEDRVATENASAGESSAGDGSVAKWRLSYKPVCILYDLEDASKNSIIYNYDGNRSIAHTKRQISGGLVGVGGSMGSNSTNCGDKVMPLFSIGSTVENSHRNSAVCESEKFLVAERNNKNSHNTPPTLQSQQRPPLQTRAKYVGYECEEGHQRSQPPTQCNARTTKQARREGGANEEESGSPMMPPKVYLIPDSVAAWKFLLLDANYAEDEEDVIMSVPNLLDIPYDDPTVMMETKKLPPLQVPSKEAKTQKSNPLNPRKYVMSGRLNIEEQNTDFLHKSIVGSYKKIEFGSVDNLNILSKSKSTSSILSSSQPKKSPRFLRFRPSSPRDDAAAKQDKQRTVIFGSDLNTMKLDAETGVPKFVVECIRLIEEPENIQTNGVYRASGNKNSIELVKKRMNDRLNLRKDTIWQFLEKQDIHTLTGSLKLFFRSLSAQLIPDSLFDQLPEKLGDETSLESIRIVVEVLEEVPKATLKFLVKHLTVVTENQAENLMNSSNLSICWGACLFASSATAFDSFESGNILRKNHFVKVLIDHYHQIFQH